MKTAGRESTQQNQTSITAFALLQMLDIGQTHSRTHWLPLTFIDLALPKHKTGGPRLTQASLISRQPIYIIMLVLSSVVVPVKVQAVSRDLLVVASTSEK